MKIFKQKNIKKPYFLIVVLSFFFIFSFSLFFNYKSLASTLGKINQSVPFVSQAPLGEWEDPRQQDACEEAVVLMALAWGRENFNLNYSPSQWRDEILALSDFQQEKYGEYRDASLKDIEGRMFRDYFNYEKTEIKDVTSPADIILELEKGNLVLIPANGQALKNPNFKVPGPERHMVLIKGYDYEKEEFITNDPGTRNGSDYRYKKDLLFEAIRAYKTGYHLPFD